MGLLVYIPAVLGILRYRFWAYWRWVVALFIWLTAIPFLFDGHGSLERPEGDGVVTQMLRRITNDGPLMALEGFLVMVVFWGVAIYLVRKLYAEVAAASPSAIRPVTNLRKGMELLPVTVAFGLSIYSTMLALDGLGGGRPALASGADMDVEAAIDQEVALTNASAPLKLDDITTLTRAMRDGRTMIVDHKISSPTVPRAALESYLQESKLAEVCAMEDARRLLLGGGSIRYRYVLPTGGAPVEFGVKPGDCAQSEAAAQPQNNSSISR